MHQNKNELFPALTQRIASDALVYHGGRLPIKFAYELYLAGPGAFEGVKCFEEQNCTALLVIQSLRDTIVDPQGAIAFRDAWNGPSDILILRDKGWHYVLHEHDCCVDVRSRIINFIANHL